MKIKFLKIIKNEIIILNKNVPEYSFLFLTKIVLKEINLLVLSTKSNNI